MKKMRAYLLNLGMMASESNSAAWWGSTAASCAEPNMPHKMTKTPSYAVLIDHPEAGWILYDTGMGDPTAWPRHIRDFVAADKPAETEMERQLALLGLKPADIRYVIISHMHFDHIGNDALFAETADFFVAEAEAEYAAKNVLHSADPAGRGYYLREDVLLPRRSLTYLDRDETLFPGVETVLLPGHTPGVMGLLLHLEGGTILFPSDAAAFRGNLEYRQPAGVYDSLGYARSIRKIHDLQKKYNARVFCSHDSEQVCGELRFAPDCYE